ncbi:MAG: thioredoxin family protein, partial [Sulfurovum sp.]|nr:thioredoxin family protein [Sulfurovum sp.]
VNSKMVPVIVTYEGVLSYPIEMYYTTIFPTLFFVDSERELFLHEPLYGEEITQDIVSEICK